MNQLKFNFVENYYDKYAERYSSERVGRGLLFNDFIERPAFNEILDRFPSWRDKKVLDIGSGPGLYTKELANLGAHVDSIDISKKMLSLARDFCKKELPSSLFSNINFKHADFNSIALENTHYDLIIATFMLSYFDDLEAFFKKAKKALNRKGRIIASTLHPTRMACSRNQDTHILDNYFDSSYYTSDFISKNNTIKLRRWTLQEVSEAAYKSGLLIEMQLEPMPTGNIPSKLSDEARIYKLKPSVLMMVFRRL